MAPTPRHAGVSQSGSRSSTSSCVSPCPSRYPILDSLKMQVGFSASSASLLSSELLSSRDQRVAFLLDSKMSMSALGPIRAEPTQHCFTRSARLHKRLGLLQTFRFCPFSRQSRELYCVECDVLPHHGNNGIHWLFRFLESLCHTVN